jgi:hypothetical protein
LNLPSRCGITDGAGRDSAMTWYFSFIGDLDDPGFFWDNPPDAAWNGNLPRRIVPAEKHLDIGASVFFVTEQIRSGAHEGRRLDWGAWGLKMTGSELAAHFGPDHKYAAAIATLDPARCYVLVAAEGG